MGLVELVERMERVEALEGAARPLMKATGRLTSPRLVKNALSGSWLGHRLHPLLTDVVIGAWMSGALLDLVRRGRPERSIERLMVLGAVAALPTAAAGASDWADTTQPAQHRSGLVHGVGNVVALGLQVASLAARRSGDPERGRRLTLLAMAALGGTGYLGGHLSYALGAGVDHPTGAVPEGWHRVGRLDDLPEGRPTSAAVDGTAVVLVRRGAEVSALLATCNHAGGPLGEGRVSDGCVTCPWHGSTFRLSDGGVVRAPATSAQPALMTRVVGGDVEVAPPPGR